MAARKTRRSRRSKRRRELPKICEWCGRENRPRAEECESCGAKRFAPEFVKRLRHVNRNFYVQVTRSRPLGGVPSRDRITLYKWWPGPNGRASLNINKPSECDAIRRIIDEDLAPFLKWKTRKELLAEVAERAKEEGATQRRMRSLADQDPDLFIKILKEPKLEKATEGDCSQIAAALSDIGRILLNADESLRAAIRGVVRKLPKQGARAINELADLMETLTLGQITAVTTEVTRRLGLLQTFKERALDDRTYEIRGPGSIHRLLEQAMWIVDERYWLMHSNESLRTVVGKELAKQHKKYARKRPDFVCGTVDNVLIVIELKRPSHTLVVEDLNQLEQYIVVINQHQGSRMPFQAMLVGQKVHPDLRDVLTIRGGTRFSIKTFTDLIGDTERRYREYLKAVDQSITA